LRNFRVFCFWFSKIIFLNCTRTKYTPGIPCTLFKCYEIYLEQSCLPRHFTISSNCYLVNNIDLLPMYRVRTLTTRRLKYKSPDLKTPKDQNSKHSTLHRAHTHTRTHETHKSSSIKYRV